MASVERLLYYNNNLEPEETGNNSDKLPEKWPQSGTIEFDDVEARYQKEMDPVLRKVSFTINDKEKVGIVGRTGAGKIQF